MKRRSSRLCLAAEKDKPGSWQSVRRTSSRVSDMFIDREIVELALPANAGDQTKSLSSYRADWIVRQHPEQRLIWLAGVWSARPVRSARREVPVARRKRRHPLAARNGNGFRLSGAAGALAARLVSSGWARTTTRLGIQPGSRVERDSRCRRALVEINWLISVVMPPHGVTEQMPSRPENDTPASV